jgi:pyrroloquinoline quinone (PQQ) biosynthesis protein C
MRTTIESSYQPQLRHCTIVDTNPNAPLVIVVGTDQFELATESGTKDQFLRLKRYLDGRHTIEQIAERTGLGIDEVLGVINSFEEMGLLRRAETRDLISTGAFLDQVEKSCVMWSRQVGYHRLFGMLGRGEVPQDVFQGLILETYQFVASAPKHIGVAVAHASTEHWRTLLSQYLVEEYNHAKMILLAAERTGIPKDQVVNAHPIIGTMSLVNMLCEVGRQSTLGYLACTNLFEARGDDFGGSRAEFEAMAERYGFEPEVVAPIIEHAQMDVEAGHASLLREALEGVPCVSAEDAHRAANHLHDVKHSFDQYHDQILQYYSDPSNYIPRLKVDYFSL